MSVVIIRKRSQAGQSILLAVVAMGLVMAGGLGFAIDTAQLYLHRQMAQAAADAAATAGIMSLFQGVNVVGATGYFDPSATFTCGVNNAKIPCKYASYHGFGTSADDTITVSFPTTASGYSGTLSSDSPNQIKIVISRQVHNNFIRFFGAAATTSIKATATAAIVEVVSPTPIIVTHPTAANALSGNGNTSITICGGPSRSIQVNSSNPNAVSISTIDLSHAGPDDSGGCTTGTGADMGVFGGPSSKPGSLNLGSKGHYVQPASPILDPLAFVNPPAVPAVAPAKVTIHSPTDGCTAANCSEWSPGLYTSGIDFDANNVFKPGVYYIQSTKGLTMKHVDSAVMCSTCAADANTGKGMLVYDTGPAGSSLGNNKSGGFNISTNVTGVTLVGAGVTVTTPPATPVAPAAPYYGILFFEDRTADAQTHTFGQGNGCFDLIGTMYITNTLAIMQANANHFQGMDYHGTPCSGTVNQGEIITGKLSLAGTADITMNLFPAGFLKIRQVALVQ